MRKKRNSFRRSSGKQRKDNLFTINLAALSDKLVAELFQPPIKIIAIGPNGEEI